MNYEKHHFADDDIVYADDMNRIEDAIVDLYEHGRGTQRQNNHTSVSEIADVARSYHKARYQPDGVTPVFLYDQDHTPLGSKYDPNSEEYAGAIDCSTYIGLVLRGIPVEKSPYAHLINAQIEDGEQDEGDENNGSDDYPTDEDVAPGDSPHDPASVLANVADYGWAINPFEWKLPVVPGGDPKPVRTASQLAQWMYERGQAVEIDDVFSNLMPGDIIFWAKKDKDGNWVQPNRFKHISHVAICCSRYDAPDEDGWPTGYPYKHTMLEVTTIKPYVLNRTLEKCSPGSVVLVCRPDLGALTPGDFAGNINTTFGVTDISSWYRPGLYYLTSNVIGGLPEGVESGKYYALRVEVTRTRMGKVYSVIHTLIDTKNNGATYVNTQYCYEHPPTSDGWAGWRKEGGGGSDLTDAPVTSVNGRTGAVSLTAADVGALPDSYTPPDQTAEQVGADPAGTAVAAVSGHNTSTDAHNDLRLLVAELTTRLNALANSTDEDLDQMAELVAYIKANKSLIDGITTSKVSVSDIVNNLTANVSNRPLSAAQGVELKALIDGLSASLANYQPRGEYALVNQIPAVPKNISAFTNDAGYLTQHQDISGKLDADKLPNAINAALTHDRESGGLPDYWLTHLAAKIPLISTAIEAAGRNKSAFYFYTDGHRINSAGKTPAILRYLYRHTSIQKTNNGGDIFEPFGTGSDNLALMREYMADTRTIRDHHSVIGNHDEDNEALSSDAQMYGFYFAWEESNDVVWGGYHYYYIDNKSEKTRYIYLDTGKFAVSDAEMQFVIDTLTATPEGWHVVVISHIWHDHNISAIPDYVQNLLSVFDSYNARSTGSITHNGTAFAYDFSASLGNVEFCIGGHLHWDAVLQSPKGIPIIITDSDSYYSRGGETTAGTTTECCIDSVIADYDARKVKLIRLGHGSDRTVTLPDYGQVVGYTNQLPISTDENGAIYNGKGWKENTRIGSTGGETTQDGIGLTGFIPAGNNSDIRITSSVAVTSDYSNQSVALYDATKQFLYRLNWASLNTGNMLTINADGSIEYRLNAAYWTALAGKTVAYVRLSFPGINGDAIVTIDELIE